MTNDQKMPVIFIGHGSPENAFESNVFSQTWAKLADTLPIPKAILSISAHWTASEHWNRGTTAVTAMTEPRTIHDFYGFPEFYDAYTYEAPGSPELAARVMEIVESVTVEEDSEWGLDHGTWCVLKNMYPDADIPVIQLSLDESLSPEEHFEIGKELAALRNEGVLILGSGNVVHNLSALSPETHPWAAAFDDFVKRSLADTDADALLRYEKHPDFELALPTDEHFLPLLYVVGAAGNDEPHFFNELMFAGSISMRCVAYWDGELSL
ncbi:MAG: 4,5-DOPA dioxygenase extradiol [Candidatus Moranbacteria bacterium]|nr:4,5-DOPA dioxygenase extradiol [Candidatus Moranbacteria bacterium]